MNPIEVPDFEVIMPKDDPIRHEKWHREDHAFYALLPELLKTFPEEYVAIHEGRVVAHGMDENEVVNQAYREQGYQPILVRKVTSAPPRIVRIPTFRVIRD